MYFRKRRRGSGSHRQEDMPRSAFARGAGREADGGAGAVGFQAALLTQLVQEEFRGRRQALDPAALANDREISGGEILEASQSGADARRQLLYWTSDFPQCSQEAL